MSLLRPLTEKDIEPWPTLACGAGARIGRARVLWGVQHRWWPCTCVVGPMWHCNLVTWALMLVPSSLFLAIAAPHMHVAWAVVEMVALLWAAGALATTAWSNPGFLPALKPEAVEARRAEILEAGYQDAMTFCTKCNNFRDSTVHHEYEVDRCVYDLDHFCPWTGTDIAQQISAFYVYLWGILALLLATGFGWATYALL